MSHLKLRGKSVWIIYSDKSGLRQQKPTGFILETVNKRNGKIQWPAEVVYFKREFDRRLVFGKWGFEFSGKGLKISELLDEFLLAHGSTRKPATQYLYRLAVKSLIEFLGDADTRRIDQDDLARYRDWMLKEKGDQNTSRSMRSLSKIFSWAEGRQLIPFSPVTSEHRVKVKGRPIRIFSDEHLEKIFEHARAPMRDQLRFLYLTGLRLGESCALKWEDVEMKEKVIRVWNEKEERWDYLPMDPMLLEFMAALPRAYEPFVFEGRHVGSVSTYLRRLIKRLKLPTELRAHTLRANFISRLVNAGLSESTVMALARHRSLQTTHKHYVAFDHSKLRKALEKSRA